MAEKVLEVFRKHDSDGFGILSDDEFRACLTELGIPDKYVSMLFEMADVNNDGVISYSEFVAWVFSFLDSDDSAASSSPDKPEDCGGCMMQRKAVMKRRRRPGRRTKPTVSYVERAQVQVGDNPLSTIPIRAAESVASEAVECAVIVLKNMLSHANAQVLERMVMWQCAVGIIGRDQKTTDLPPHAQFKGVSTGDGRDFDNGTRGLGGTKYVPTTSVGEENLTMKDDKFYWAESILVHEFGHAVMNCGFDEEQINKIKSLYQEAIKEYDRGLYMFSTAEELWANGTQAYFHAINRNDVNAGINTREALKDKLPGVLSLMKEVYGDNPWTYRDTMPGVWR